MKIEPQDDKWLIREVQRGLQQWRAEQGNGENNRAQARDGKSTKTKTSDNYETKREREQKESENEGIEFVW